MENINPMEPINRKSLFGEIENRSYYLNECKKANDEIKKLTSATTNGISESEMAENFYSKYKVEIPLISEKPNDCKFELHDDGKVIYHIPFTGNGEIFNFMPRSVYFPEKPYGNIGFNELIMEYPINDGECSTAEHVSKRIKKSFNENYTKIVNTLNLVSKDCEKNNEAMKKRIEEYVKERYNEINREDDIRKRLNTLE